MALTTTQISELYVSIFNRASEKSGNESWAAKDLTAAEIADEMLATSDAQAYFGTSIDTNRAFVELIYANTLNKQPADDVDGINYWVGLLDAGMSKGTMVAQLNAAVATYAPGAENYDANNAATVAAYEQFTNRVAVSDYAAEKILTTPSDYVTSTSFGANGLNVTADAATTTAAKSAVLTVAATTATEYYAAVTNNPAATVAELNAAFDAAVAAAADIETAKIATYDAAVATYDAAVATAATSKTAADTAAANVSTLALATDAKTAADTAATDAAAVVTAAAAVSTAAADTAATEDDTTAATNATAADNASTAANTAADAIQVVVDNLTPQTFTIAAAATTVVEGNTLDFTVTADHARDVDTTVNYQIQGVAVAGGTADPVADLGVLNGTATILAGETTATVTITPTADQVTEGYEGFKVVLLDSAFAETASSGNVVISDPANAGQTFNLTTGVDNFTGGTANDTFNATNTTLTALDDLNGGTGNDVLNIDDVANTTTDIVPASATIANIETMNIKGAAAVTADVSGTNVTGLNTLNLTKAGGAVALTAATTTDVNVSGVTGVTGVKGGNNVSVTDATAGNNITVGNSAAGGDAAGTITITDTDNSGANAISVEGGTDVTVTTTADKASSGSITVGDATNGEATGNVTVTQNSTSNGTGMTAGNVTVTSAVAAGPINVTEFVPLSVSSLNNIEPALELDPLNTGAVNVLFVKVCVPVKVTSPTFCGVIFVNETESDPNVADVFVVHIHIVLSFVEP